jgi:L-lysine 2,3-aminomutase
VESGAHHSNEPKGVNDPGTGLSPWRLALREAIRDPDELCREVGLDPSVAANMRAAQATFPLLVTRSFCRRMRRGDPRDPLLRQVLPLDDEMVPQAGYSDDPVGESGCALLPGLLQKYQGRALLVTTEACAVHCRYCFRRHFPYQERTRGRQWWQPALARLAEDPSVSELILSGGDPLTLGDEQLAALVTDAEGVPHLRRLRIHTRLPVVLPERVDAALCAWIAASRFDVVVVIHANHPAEIDAEVGAACRRLQAAGAIVLNQAVLLAGVNDAVETLVALSEAVFAAGVLPYYLHALDPVRGAAHFAVPDQVAVELIAGVAAQLPGYLVPRLVREIPGAPGKMPLGTATAELSLP